MIPHSTIEPFGYTGIPTICGIDDKIRQLVAYARVMYDNIPPPILPSDINMLELRLLGRNGSYDLSITWEKEECQRGYHLLAFRIPEGCGYITAHLYPPLRNEV